MLTLAFVLMFVAGGAAGYVLKAILIHRAFAAMREGRASDHPCLIEGCFDRSRHSHLH